MNKPLNKTVPFPHGVSSDQLAWIITKAVWVALPDLSQYGREIRVRRAQVWRHMLAAIRRAVQEYQAVQALAETNCGEWVH